MKRQYLNVACALAVALVPMPALAVDGTILIDQNRALAGNVTAGDLPGFPVTLSVPGSYRLASNLVVPTATTTAIEVTSPNVTIDLNGFSIIGPGVNNMENPVVDGVGILARANDVSVRNGSIYGMGGGGIVLRSGGQVQNMQVHDNFQAGIFVGGGTVARASIIDNVIRNNVFSNGQVGAAEDLITGSYVVLRGNVVEGRVDVLCPAVIVGNVVHGSLFTENGSGQCTLAQNNPAP